MRTKLLAIAGATAVTLFLFPSSAQAGHSWGGYHWARTANPFTLQLGDNVSSQWDSALSGASADWSRSTVLDTRVVAGLSNPKNCRGTTGRVEVCNSTYGNTGWLGIASISITGGTHITQGTVKLNDTYFNTPQYNTAAWRNLVTCQEVGHTFGLDHQDEDFNNANLGTCMDYTNDPSTNQHPNQHDYDELASIYSHVDSTSTLGTAAAAGASVGNSPESWGSLVSGSRADRHSTYVRHFADGTTVVTHVIWA
ncbi:hypothetical protein [Micromonospora globbae]|uniref:Peptidase M10 metallopeptidase domain-containing protein n=1 Tax=Micromonospora globbae TaxID=1894969 RepID=A0A420EQF2_9ACTN|nr:hypothetical protein [Micromonospora globbae]RKF22905.1 hypothetical protein D7I43_30910 [Micromonospora globbae]